METKKLLKNLKHKFSGMLCLVMLLGFTTSAWAADPSGKTLYLTPGSNWCKDNAKFCLYYYGSNSGWVAGTLVSGSGATAIYSFDIPSGKGISNVIFVRRDPSQSGCDWSWNQTNDLTYDGTNNLYTVADDAWSKGNGRWSTYNPCTGPTVTTGDATSVTAHTATLPGTVSSTTDLTEVGIKMGDSYYQASSVASSFSFAATNLESGKQYTYQAYAKKSCGTFLGTEKTFTTTSVTYEFTVYFKANSGWTNPYIHMWPVGSSDPFVNNQQMTAVEGASGWYKYDVTTTNQKWMIILKNGSEWGTKSDDSGPFDSTDSEHCYIVSNSKVTATVCPVICTAPQASDFTVTNNEKTYNGSAQTATVSGKSGMGTLTVKYGGSASQTNAGKYAITVDVAAGTTYCAASGISLGNFVINQKAPTASDFSLSDNTKTYTGSALKPTFNKNTGVDCSFSKYYYSNDSGSTWTEYTNGPTNAGTYKVKVDVSAGTNYSAATGIVLGQTFTITCPSVATPTFSGYSAAVCKGTTVNLTASVSSGAVGTCTYNWSNPADWTNVSKNGNKFSANANSTGSVTLTVTNGCGTTSSQGTQAVTVKPLNSLTSVSLDPSTIKEGETSTATATGEVISDGASDVWTSSDTDVATVVESTGVVTGVKEGTANIIYTISGGCGPTVSQSAQISVIPNCDTPEPGSIDGTLAVCSGSGTTLTLKNHETTNTTIEWYKNDAPTGTKTNPYSTGNLSTPATYKVRVSRVGVANCYAETPTVTVTVTAIPSITAQGGERCGNGEVTLQATATPVGCTVNWYDAETGGTKQGEGLGKEVNVTVGSPVTLYAEAVTKDAAACKSASRASATATAKAVPSISSISAEGGCGAGDITFRSTGVSDGATVNWYEGSTKVGEGATKVYTSQAEGTIKTLKAKVVKDGCDSEFTSETTGTRLANPSLTVTAPSAAYGWEDATFTVTGDGTITGSVTQTAGSGGIINDKTFKGHVNDTFRASYTATGDNGCTTQKSAEVTVEKAVESCD